MEWEVFSSELLLCNEMKLLSVIIHDPASPSVNVDEKLILPHSHTVKLSSVLNICYLQELWIGICMFLYRLLQYSSRSGGFRIVMFAVKLHILFSWQRQTCCISSSCVFVSKIIRQIREFTEHHLQSIIKSLWRVTAQSKKKWCLSSSIFSLCVKT